MSSHCCCTGSPIVVQYHSSIPALYFQPCLPQFSHNRLALSRRGFRTRSFLGLGELWDVAEDIASGPIELSQDVDAFADQEITPIQTVAGYVLSIAIAVLLFRAVRKRFQRVKGKRFRSAGEESVGDIKAQAKASAIQNLQTAPEIRTPPPSVSQTFLGAVTAGVISLFLYKFAVTVEASFAEKAVSTNFSIRNLTITVRTIINGLCYLATFVFAANSIGLGLYSVQLLFDLGNQSTDPPNENKKAYDAESDKSGESQPTDKE